jgi:hypothetical protein
MPPPPCCVFDIDALEGRVAVVVEADTLLLCEEENDDDDEEGGGGGKPAPPPLLLPVLCGWVLFAAAFLRAATEAFTNRCNAATS